MWKYEKKKKSCSQLFLPSLHILYLKYFNNCSWVTWGSRGMLPLKQTSLFPWTATARQWLSRSRSHTQIPGVLSKVVKLLFSGEILFLCLFFFFSNQVLLSLELHFPNATFFPPQETTVVQYFTAPPLRSVRAPFNAKSHWKWHFWRRKLSDLTLFLVNCFSSW